ncbi:MAG: flagellar basal body-associated FliL family protein [Planctomycetota bacterium]|nr:flagellar basal body-associated FliL family protein [Planctomycetota bacterium]
MVTERKAGVEEKQEAQVAAPAPAKLSVPASIWGTFAVLIVMVAGIFFALGTIWKRPGVEEPSVVKPVEYYALGPFSREMPEDSTNNHLVRVFSITVSLELSNNADKNETKQLLDVNKLKIRDQVWSLLSGMTYVRANTTEAREELRKKIHGIVNQQIGSNRVESVWFDQ